MFRSATDAIDRLQQSIELGAINIRGRFYPRLSESSRQSLTRYCLDRKAPPDPIDGFFYFAYLFNAWLSLSFMAVVLMFALAFLGEALAQDTGYAIGLSVAFFFEVASLVGGGDALCRRYLTKAARRRFVAASFTLDATTTRMMRLARVRTGTPILQLGIAAVAVALFVTH